MVPQVLQCPQNRLRKYGLGLHLTGQYASLVNVLGALAPAGPELKIVADIQVLLKLVGFDKSTLIRRKSSQNRFREFYLRLFQLSPKGQELMSLLTLFGGLKRGIEK